MKLGNPIMIMTTTNNVEGMVINQYLGIITGEAILGVNIFKDFFASIRNIVGGQSTSYEKELKEARRIAFSKLEKKAFQLEANAIIGIDVDYETIQGQTGSMLMVSITGTAVQF